MNGTKVFLVAGAIECELPEMLRMNIDDEELCEWLMTANVGDVFTSVGETCERIR